MRPALTLATVLIVSTLFADDSPPIFPTDAGMVNIKDYGATGNGENDDTASIRQAIAENMNDSRTLFFPAGTYLISDTIEWKNGRGKFMAYLTWQGEERGKTVIKLHNECDGFNDRSLPRPMVRTGSIAAPGNGAGKMSFGNYVFGMTFDTGSGNPGAVGLDFNASETGAVANVAIVSGDGEGYAGLDLRRQIGSCSIRNLTVEGFDNGIVTDGVLSCVTMSDITLKHQNQTGILQRAGTVVIERTTSINAVPAVTIEDGLTTILSSRMEGGDPERAAVVNEGALLVRATSLDGYLGLTKTVGSEQGEIDEYISHPPLSLFTPKEKTFSLPIERSPEHAAEAAENWVNVEDFGAKRNDGNDDSEGIQKAMDSGETTVYFPKGFYTINRTIIVRANVRRVIGFGSMLRTEVTSFRFKNSGHSVIIERFGSVGRIEHASPEAATVRDCSGVEPVLAPGKRTLFLENCLVNSIKVIGKQSVYARGVTFAESSSEPALLNDGGTLWTAGGVIDHSATAARTINGGKSEILGSLFYSQSGRDDDAAALNVENSWFVVSSSFPTETGQKTAVVEEYQRSIKKTLTRENLVGTNRSVIPLYVGFIIEDPTPPTAPSELEAEPVSPSSIKLSWQQAQDGESGISCYNVLRNGELITALVETAFVDKGLTEATVYRYEVNAMNGGLKESGKISATGTTFPDTTPPSIEQIRCLLSATKVLVVFSEPVNVTSTSASAHYSIENEGPVTAAIPDDDGRTVTLTAPPLTPGEDYVLVINEVKDRAKTPNEIEPGTRVPFTFIPPGDGLKGKYFRNARLEGKPETRTDPTIDFDWGTGPPMRSFPTDNFSVRWTGQILPEHSQVYTFHAITDDGVRLWVNGEQVVTYWLDRAPSESTGSIELEADTFYDIKMEYFEHGGGAMARLLWSGPSTPRQIIPQRNLFSSRIE